MENGSTASAPADAMEEVRPRFGDPLTIGERVKYSLGFITAMFPIGRDDKAGTFVAGGREADRIGIVIALGEPLPHLATVEWDDGVRTTVAQGSLVRPQHVQPDAGQFHYQSTFLLQYEQINSPRWSA